MTETQEPSAQELRDRMNHALDMEHDRQVMKREWLKVQALMRPANHS